MEGEESVEDDCDKMDDSTRASPTDQDKNMDKQTSKSLTLKGAQNLGAQWG